MQLSDYLARGISNLAWHIRVNRETINDDSKMLTEIHESLQRLVDDYNRLTGKKLDY
jgi:hypothetical protein